MSIQLQITVNRFTHEGALYALGAGGLAGSADYASECLMYVDLEFYDLKHIGPTLIELTEQGIPFLLTYGDEPRVVS